MMPDLRRRRCLQALGLSALFLPSLAWQQSQQKSAQAAATATKRLNSRSKPPLTRLLLYFCTQGTFRPNWSFNPQHVPETIARTFDLSALKVDDFSRCLAPLYPQREHLLLLDGISLALTSQFSQNEHNTGHAVALSGARPHYEGNAVVRVSGPSIDQIIAASFASATPLPFLNYGRAFASVSHDHRGQPIPHESDALAAFARLFPGHGTNDSPISLRTRASVLDRVAQTTKAIEQRLSAEDRAKLAQHHALIRDLERQLLAMQDLKCPTPAPPKPAPDDPQAWIDWNSETWSSLAIAALTCGLTRVATVYDSGPDCRYLGLEDEDIHRDVAHFVDLKPEAGDGMTAFYRYHAARFAKIIEQLAAIADGDGTMLDSTLVLMVNELGSPSHGWAHYPMILAGAKNRLINGRYFYWPATQTVQGSLTKAAIGPAHNRVLVSIAQAFDLELDTIGERELRDVDGQPIALHGRLPEIFRS